MDPLAPMITMALPDMMQVCVPADWKEKRIVQFANKELPPNGKGPWSIRNSGPQDKTLCTVRTGFVHIILVK